MDSPEKDPLSLIIYVDLSGSMYEKSALGERSKIDVISDVTQSLVTRLKDSCGPVDVAVSNLAYAQVSGGYIGGELIFREGEPLFLNEKNPDLGPLLLDRMLVGYEEATKTKARATYQINGFEKTYTTIFHTLLGHLQKSPRFPNKGIVASLLISDSAPMFEEGLGPLPVKNQILEDIPGDRFISGVLGAGDTSCMDRPFVRDQILSRHRPFNQDSLKIFAKHQGGYFWNLCETSLLEESLNEFFQLIMAEAQCQFYS